MFYLIDIVTFFLEKKSCKKFKKARLLPTGNSASRAFNPNARVEYLLKSIKRKCSCFLVRLMSTKRANPKLCGIDALLVRQANVLGWFSWCLFLCFFLLGMQKKERNISLTFFILQRICIL